ncbi:MAG: hypothetical protein DRJ40_05740 [Thermoprotei archaeon]|nr:MAG: hypothetical protein DRJ40_05740 [Thermoprotei archaeon]
MTPVLEVGEVSLVVALFHVPRGDVETTDLVAFFSSSIVDELELEREATLTQVIFTNCLSIAALSSERYCLVELGGRKFALYLGDDLALAIWRDDIPFSRDSVFEYLKVLRKLYEEGELCSEHLVPIEYLDGDFDSRAIKYSTYVLDFAEEEAKRDPITYVRLVLAATVPQFLEEWEKVLVTLPRKFFEVVIAIPRREFVNYLLQLIDKGILRVYR